MRIHIQQKQELSQVIALNSKQHDLKKSKNKSI